jgi:hypothetical protein
MQEAAAAKKDEGSFQNVHMRRRYLLLIRD